MKNEKKIPIILVLLLLFALISPIIIIWLGIFLGQFIKMPLLVLSAILFLITIFIAWTGRLGR